MRKLHSIAIIASLGLAIPATASITITNFSFEADENISLAGGFADGERVDFGGQLTGWISQSGLDVQVAVGWKDITLAELEPNPAVGGQESQALSLITGASVLNTTATAWSSLSAGDTLAMTISLGMRNVVGLDWNENTFFGLTDGDADFTTIEISDTVANSGVIANNPVTGTQSGDGRFVDVGFSYTVQASDLTRTGNIGIFIYSEGTGGVTEPWNQSFFDNVRLDLTPVPEPTSVSLLGLACIATLLRRRR